MDSKLLHHHIIGGSVIIANLLLQAQSRVHLSDLLDLPNQPSDDNREGQVWIEYYLF